LRRHKGAGEKEFGPLGLGAFWVGESDGVVVVVVVVVSS
jgi:hypothetical protein